MRKLTTPTISILMDNNLSEKEASQLGQQIKSRKRSTSKSSIAKPSPLPSHLSGAGTSRSRSHPYRRTTRPAIKPYIQRWAPHQAEPTKEEKLKEIESQLESVSSLPPHSKFALHRRQVLAQAQRLLQRTTQLTEDEQQELDRLLSALNLS